jgi:hypothetical protein
MHRIHLAVVVGFLTIATTISAQESGSDSTRTPTETEDPESAIPQKSAAQLELEFEKLRAEVNNLEIENEALGVGTRKFSAILGGIGGITGALLTFLVGFAGLRLKAVQDERLRQEKNLEERRLGQDRRLAREKQTLEVFRDLGSENPRTQIAAASLLLQRLKSPQLPDSEEDMERPTIIKVLVSVLKEKRQTDEAGFDTLRKYIADNLLEILGDDIRSYDWQNVNLSKVWWKGIDASGVDFYRANLREAGFRDADLTNAVFYEADLSNAVLKNAKLAGCNFYDAILDGTSLQGASYDEHTVWPNGFAVETSGAVRIEPPLPTAHG